MAADRREYDIEVDRGSHALETLLENHIDRAFDKYTAYALRNAFSVPDGIELVLVSLAHGNAACEWRRVAGMGRIVVEEGSP